MINYLVNNFDIAIITIVIIGLFVWSLKQED